MVSEQGVRADEPLAQAMNAVRERVIGARHIHQFFQLSFERLIAFAQHLHLPLDQTHGGSRVAKMRKPQLGEQWAVSLEEIRVGLQVFRDA